MKINNILKQYIKNGSITVLDIGARGGLHHRWKKIEKFINVIGFEPEKKECKRLNALKWDTNTRFLPIALGEKKKNSQIYICESPGCTSMIEPANKYIEDFSYSRYFKIIGKEDLSVFPLIDICVDEKIKPDFIKIDTQGTELPILKGAGVLLDVVKLMELEVEFNPIYKNQPLFSDIDRFLRKQGFELLGLRRSFWRRKIPKELRNISSNGGQIMHGDALFLNMKLLNSEKIGVQDVIIFLMLLSVYNQDDLIIHLLSKPHKKLNSIPLKGRLELIKLLVSNNKSANFFSSIFNNWVMKYFFRKLKLPLTNRQWRLLVDKFRSNDVTDWHDPDFY